VPARPKIVLVVTLAERGGAQTYVASLLPALTPAFDVIVAAHGPGPLRDAARAAGARYVALQRMRRDLDPLHDLLALGELVRLLRRERPHIVHANSSKAGVLARLAAAFTRVPVRVFTVHGWAHAAHHGAAGTVYRWADRLMAPLTTLTICVAERERQVGLAARTCRAASTVVVPNAVDVAATEVAHAPRGPARVVSVGRLKAPKDPVTLVRAVALMRSSCEVVLAGDGPDREALTRELQAAGVADRVELAGDRGDVAQLLSGATVFVLSSRSEGAPMSVLEAMAAGLPVVATAVGGIPELVEDGRTGLLVAPGDPHALATALERVLEDPEFGRRLGAAGRERALARFDLAVNRRAHLDLYTRELVRRGLPAPMP
jgi:glycosyltransferase involved in cell wall biosynthesis